MCDSFEKSKKLCYSNVKMTVYSNCAYTSPVVVRVEMAVDGNDYESEDAIAQNSTKSVGEVFDYLVDKINRMAAKKKWEGDSYGDR